MKNYILLSTATHITSHMGLSGSSTACAKPHVQCLHAYSASRFVNASYVHFTVYAKFMVGVRKTLAVLVAVDIMKFCSVV